MLDQPHIAWDGHITLTPTDREITIKIGDCKIAETNNAIILQEGRYPPVYYIPRQDIDETFLMASSTKTSCPWKGDASYLTYRNQDHEITDLLWYYAEPLEQVAPLSDYVAFYKTHVDIQVS